MYGSNPFWKILNVILIIAGIIGVLQPAFSEGGGIYHVFALLFEPHFTLEFIFKWLLLIFLVFCTYVFVIDEIFHRIPVTIIHADVELKFLTLDGSYRRRPFPRVPNGIAMDFHW
jgi:hypothetical protein